MQPQRPRSRPGLANDQEVDLVHSAGLSSGTYSVAGENPYLSLEETPLDHPALEFRSVVTTLHLVVKALLPRWRRQKRTRAVIVSSMSGVRAVPLGFSHSSAKAALHQAVRSLTLELNPIGIRFSEVAPGIVNTGMYDPPAVDAAARAISRAFGYEYAPGALPQMNVSAVADAALLCLTSDAHILSINLVADGQFPNLGA